MRLLACPKREDFLKEAELHRRLVLARPALQDLLKHYRPEQADCVYRFYHGSFKVYDFQGMTLEIVKALQAVAPELPLNETFLQIVKAGTGQAFGDESNARWLEETRPIVEAFLHAFLFLEIAVKYSGRKRSPLPPWEPDYALFLYLYAMR